jgi:hypothetical protein
MVSAISECTVKWASCEHPESASTRTLNRRWLKKILDPGTGSRVHTHL